jgi:hypothetical protein
MILRNLIFQAEIVEQRFRTRVLPHHKQQASENYDPEKHGKELFLHNMLPLYLGLQITVTFSTPTGDYTQNPVNERNRDVTPTTCQSLVSVSPMIRVNGDTGVYHSSWTQLTGNRSSAQVAAEEVCDE